MKMRTLAASGTLVGLLCAGGGAFRMDSAAETPDLKTPSKNGKKSEKEPLDNAIRRALTKLFSTDDLNHDDPCLEVTQALWDTFKAGEDPEAESLARGELYDCQETLTAEQLRVSLSNFHILESRTNYEMFCGDKDADTCKELQEKVKKEMDKIALGGWTYNDWAWAYDENGEIVDAAAFPGYQAFLPDPEGSHMDLWSIMTYEREGREVYSFGIACGSKEGLSTIVASSAYPSPEALVQDIQEIRNHHPIGD